MLMHFLKILPASLSCQIVRGFKQWWDLHKLISYLIITPCTCSSIFDEIVNHAKSHHAEDFIRNWFCLDRFSKCRHCPWSWCFCISLIRVFKTHSHVTFKSLLFIIFSRVFPFKATVPLSLTSCSCTLGYLWRIFERFVKLPHVFYTIRISSSIYEPLLKEITLSMTL